MTWLCTSGILVSGPCPAPKDGGSIGVHGYQAGLFGKPPVAGAYDTMQAAGFKWNRVGIFWSAIERDSPSNPDWSNETTLLNDARMHGFSILSGFIHVPGWAHCSPVGPNCTRAAGCPDADCMPTSCTPPANYLTVAPANYCYFYKFAYATLVQYGTWVAAYELWNEPNQGTFWTSSSAEFQAKIVNPGIQAIKDARANLGVSPAYVLGPSTLSNSDNVASDINTWLGGYASSVDYISVHAYGSESDQTAVQSAAASYGRPFWITEGGFATDQCATSCSGNVGSSLNTVQRNCVGNSLCRKDFIFYLHDPGCRPANCTGSQTPCTCCTGSGTGCGDPGDWGLVTNTGLVRDRLCYLERHYGTPLTTAAPCLRTQDTCPRSDSRCAGAQ